MHNIATEFEVSRHAHGRGSLNNSATARENVEFACESLAAATHTSTTVNIDIDPTKASVTPEHQHQHQHSHSFTRASTWYRSMYGVCSRSRLASTADMMWRRDNPFCKGLGPARHNERT
jgi:hypothetical protein